MLFLSPKNGHVNFSIVKEAYLAITVNIKK